MWSFVEKCELNVFKKAFYASFLSFTYAVGLALVCYFGQDFFFSPQQKNTFKKKTSQVHLQTEVCSSAACKGGKAQYNWIKIEHLTA